MTKRNKKNIKVIPIIIKCNCGDAIADTVEDSIGCIRFPDCCDNDLEFIDFTMLKSDISNE
jgi:hypothetical protein